MWLLSSECPREWSADLDHLFLGHIEYYPSNNDLEHKEEPLPGTECTSCIRLCLLERAKIKYPNGLFAV